MGSSRSWFRLSIFYRVRAERRESPGLAAFRSNGPSPRQIAIANISCSGAYLLTREPWNVGEIYSLILQRSGPLEDIGARRICVEAQVVRRDPQGVGVQFLMPFGSELSLWRSAIKADVPQTEPEDVVREFRQSAAIAFLHRIVPEATDRVRLLLREELSNFRLESAIEIALHAQELLAIEDPAPPCIADPAIVLRILEDGSWAEIEWIQHYWAGILATACTPGVPAKDVLKFVSLLSQLTVIQTRILSGACERAAKSFHHDGRVSINELTCSALELIKIADTHDRVHIERDIQHLVELGLIEKTVKWKFFSLLDQATITPTELALVLYARCKGHHCAVEEFYATSSAPEVVNIA